MSIRKKVHCRNVEQSWDGSTSLRRVREHVGRLSDTPPGRIHHVIMFGDGFLEGRSNEIARRSTAVSAGQLDGLGMDRECKRGELCRTDGNAATDRDHRTSTTGCLERAANGRAPTVPGLPATVATESQDLRDSKTLCGDDRWNDGARLAASERNVLVRSARRATSCVLCRRSCGCQHHAHGAAAFMESAVSTNRTEQNEVDVNS